MKLLICVQGGCFTELASVRKLCPHNLCCALTLSMWSQRELVSLCRQSDCLNERWSYF